MDAAKSTSLMWMAWTEPRRKQPNEGPPGSPISTLIALVFQLYCPRKFAHSIGTHLQRNKVDLKDPRFELQRYDYYNPQTLNSFSSQDTAQPTFELPQYAPTASYVLRSVDEIRSDVQNMFDTISGVENLPIREPSSRIKTPLYKHQKQALHFLWDKEQDWQDDDINNRKDILWQTKYRDNNRKYYLHVITGEEVSTRPASCRGGILADEMGLGKTLSILSLVSDDASMAAGHAFSQKAPPPKPSNTLIQPTVRSRGTLLVCPLSTMYNWKDQLERHFPIDRGLKWINYHGKHRAALLPRLLADNDLVITTYNMISADYCDRAMPLSYVHWFRIVLDEAHAIRNTSTKQSLAACALAAERRWAVTGTPVQNRLDVSINQLLLRAIANENTRILVLCSNFCAYVLSRPFKDSITTS